MKNSLYLQNGLLRDQPLQFPACHDYMVGCF